MKLWKLYAMALAGMLDIAVGITVVFLFGKFFGQKMGLMSYVAGVFLSIAPDFDIIFLYLTDKKSHHEFITHRPIIVLALVAGIGWFVENKFWSLLASILIFWHYLHDTEGFLGIKENGIAWLWPFSKYYYGFSDGKIVVKTSEERLKNASFKSALNQYLYPNYRSFMELGISSLLFCFICTQFIGYKGMLLFPIFWIIILIGWALYKYSGH
ncbi:MAG: hypothetical protein Athens071426_481 [Parcubacteria group bacterium Athens0714_26]|nr:MAG: hypothetical protein Athens101426_291 [Parcubacteria group bacterium Athens1014_26]TSD02533.1 MAG: hypothetical protein Athens071426_481 [Parcubacteria group bacterium Athens0714_26]